LRDELSYVEIAGVLGIPVGTVRSRLHLAVKKLRDALGEE
jgi:RNA polymerase sigma-70 factor (ECF subfamily)